MTVTTVGIRELKTHLSKYVRQVKSGDTIVITDHGKPVGRIVPVEQTVEEKILALRDSGFLEWSGEKLSLDPITPAVKLRDDVLASDLLLEDREMIIYLDTSALVKRLCIRTGFLRSPICDSVHHRARERTDCSG